MKDNIYFQTYNSPCGTLIIGSYKNEICLCDWYERNGRAKVDNRLINAFKASFINESTEIIEKTVIQLKEYFKGEREAFDLPLVVIGTPFQKKIWQTLLNIAYGEKTTYQSIANLSGNPRAVRAVASAIGANALSILIPCHRIIGSDGKLTGYAGGLYAKEYLINLEAK